MSRKTDRLAKKAAKKGKTPTVEKVEALNESSDEEIPDAVAIEQVEEEEEEQDSDMEEEVEEEEEEEQENDLDNEEDEDEEEADSQKKAPRALINDEVISIEFTQDLFEI